MPVAGFVPAGALGDGLFVGAQLAAPFEREPAAAVDLAHEPDAAPLAFSAFWFVAPVMMRTRWVDGS